MKIVFPDLATTLLEPVAKKRASRANNVVAHVHDVRELVAGVRALLDDDGVMVMEVPYLVDLLDRVKYDTVYHEHLSYFAVGPLSRLMACSMRGPAMCAIARCPIAARCSVASHPTCSSSVSTRWQRTLG